MFADIAPAFSNANAAMPKGVSYMGSTNTVTSLKGPLDSNLVAEPAQVVVLMPKRSSEGLLERIKTYSLYVLIGFVVLGILYVYLTWKSRPYEGRVLPGVAKQSMDTKWDTFAATQHEIETIEPVRAPEPVVAPVAVRAPRSVQQDNEDIFKISGSIPVWDSPEEPIDIIEKRVDEHDHTVTSIVQSREAFNKELESHLALSRKQNEQIKS